MGTDLSVCYLANPNSVHVADWLSLDPSLCRNVQIWHINENPDEGVVAESRDRDAWSPIGDSWRWIPKAIRYAALGAVARFRLPPRTLVHAHSASGYGLAALIAGRPFILTTYGSEVLSAKERSWLYRRILSLALDRASVITCTSPQMHRCLRMQFGVPASKIRQFSLGVDPLFTEPTAPRSRCELDTLRFVSLRSIAPLYRTIELVQAFRSFVQGGARTELVLVEGNANGDYLRKVEAIAAECPLIRIVRGPLSRRQIRDLLDSCHFSVSVPDSDQLSATILESMVRQVVPVLRDLDAYEPVSAASIQVAGASDLRAGILVALREAAACMRLDFDARSVVARRLVIERFGRDAAWAEYRAMIQQANDNRSEMASVRCI